MHLVNMVYASRTHEINEHTIKDILRTARNFNSKNGITGALHFSSNYFLQSLEGSREIVNSLYQKILRDDRHQDPVILTYGELSSRQFTDWSMAYVGEGVAYENHFFKYSTDAKFNPYQMSGASAEQLLKELIVSSA